MFTSTWNGISVCDTSGQVSDHSGEQKPHLTYWLYGKNYNKKEKPNFHNFSFSELIAFKIDPRSTWKAIGGDKGDPFPEL